jgi:hypothetical protein
MFRAIGARECKWLNRCWMLDGVGAYPSWRDEECSRKRGSQRMGAGGFERRESEDEDDDEEEDNPDYRLASLRMRAKSA